MKTLVLTGYDDKMKGVGDITSQVMLKYASQHGFDFMCMRCYDNKKPSAWQKIDGIVDNIPNYYKVIWLDADVLITNHDYVPPWDTGIHVSKDWGCDAVDNSFFSTGVMVVGKGGMELLEMVKLRFNPSHLFWEQDVLRKFYRDGESCIFVHERRLLNAVPIEVSSEVVEPWQEGDWICHVTMVDNARRIEIITALKEAKK